MVINCINIISLAFFGVVSALSIDNELRVITIDCYERLAIGERLNADKIYKSFPYNTVGDCKKACSEEKSVCKAFSFGISAKGNATCELSVETVKETADLKPIGTVPNTDFDVYIKKLGCTLVTEPVQHHKPLSAGDHLNSKPTTLDELNLHNTNHPLLSPQTSPGHHSDIHNVQTVVSVATGPQTVLNSAHGILVAGEHQNTYGFGTESLPYWYNDYEQSDGNYNGFANYFQGGNRFGEVNGYGNIDRYDFRPEDDGIYFNKYINKQRPRPHYSDYANPKYPRPLPDRYGSVIPHPNQYYNRPTHEDYPVSNFKPNSIYDYNRPNEKPVHENFEENPSKPVSLSLIYEIENPGKLPVRDTLYEKPPKRPYYNNGVKNQQQNYKESPPKPIVTHSTGQNGEQITSILTEIRDKACFRRVLAGKRISRGLVRRALNCETADQCQAECADEKLFICEGFNYRLDSSGRGKGDCELLSVPLSRIDVYRDTYPDPDYDYYERDRNAASLNCKHHPPGHKYGQYGVYNDYDDYRHGYRETNRFAYSDDQWPARRYDYEAPRRPPPYLPIPSDYRGPQRWSDDYYRPPPPPNRRYDEQSYDLPPPRPSAKRRGDYSYLPHTTHYDRIATRRYSGTPFPPLLPLKPPPFDQKPYDSFPSPQYYKYHWGVENRRYGDHSANSYLPPRKGNDWGVYGKFKNDYNYWGLSKYGGGGYLPPDPGLKPPQIEAVGILAVPESSLLPLEHRRPTYSYLQDECSLRSVTGFKLHKRIVKKYFAVPNIYECEMLCFKERDFSCGSYAFRYTITASEPTDNCYLSNVDYKELDNYTDLEPDRDFDVYTMNNRIKCGTSIIESRETSDCFWRVRSGERLHDKIVRDSLKADSIVDCQVECLKSKKFTCRAFSYRYGTQTVGGLIDNCQLTDWPYYELDPRVHFIPEPGFEIYERGSFGHGCEMGHFGGRGRHEHKTVFNPDQLCYIGFGSPARLLPQAVKKSVRVHSDIQCKEECSKVRSETLFQCMSFSFRSNSPGASPNCDLSDIYQRDLLPKIDYVYDPHSLLFAWDNYNPDCVIIGDDHLRTNHITSGVYEREYFPHALDTWRVYSVSGWPCKRGARCQENREAGFWFCELEGGEHSAWDYCCRPQHQCGASRGYPYLWCYVGPDRTQWRKCSDRYFPYLPDTNVLDERKYFKPNPNRQQWRPEVFRPDRPPALSPPPTRPLALSLDQYEMVFDEEFLEPPLPGGIGQPRHWPVSYLHKELPPNVNSSVKLARMETDNTKVTAIQNLINIIKNNDLKNIQYQISNESDKKDDVLLVKIPLPTNITQKTNLSNESSISLDAVSVEEEDFSKDRLQKYLPEFVEWETKRSDAKRVVENSNPLYRRAFITRTNVTNHGKHI